jgi:putative phosphoesterase
MKIAVLSDIHANLQALQAVLHDCKKQGVKEYWLLGDTINYGANPIEVIELLSGLNVTHSVMGNHDMCLFENQRLAIHGDASISRYTDNLYRKNPEAFAWLKANTEWEQIHIHERKALLLHATLDDSFWGEAPNFQETFEIMERDGIELLLCGHTHKQDFKQSGELAVANPGSVGQPRNGIPKAQYLILGEDNKRFEITHRQVDYDIEAACDAIIEAYLPEHLCKTLRTGG